jgi:hypothetical protein
MEPEAYRVMFNVIGSKCHSFISQTVGSKEEADNMLEAIAEYSLFLNETGLMYDYSNCASIQKYQNKEWSDIEDE